MDHAFDNALAKSAKFMSKIKNKISSHSKPTQLDHKSHGIPKSVQSQVKSARQRDSVAPLFSSRRVSLSLIYHECDAGRDLGWCSAGRQLLIPERTSQVFEIDDGCEYSASTLAAMFYSVPPTCIIKMLKCFCGILAGERRRSARNRSHTDSRHQMASSRSNLITIRSDVTPSLHMNSQLIRLLCDVLCDGVLKW